MALRAKVETPANGEVDVAAAAFLFAGPARAAMLDVLLDGRDHTAGQLALRAGISPSTASGHLRRLLEGGVVAYVTRGRERRYRLTSDEVANALEALARLAPPKSARSLRAVQRAVAMREARTCYDHLAGRLGVLLTQRLVDQGVLIIRHGSYDLTPEGEVRLSSLGVDVEAAHRRRRTLARLCLDWSEQRPHLAGALGAAVATMVLERGWVERRPNDRALEVTELGRARLAELGVEVP